MPAMSPIAVATHLSSEAHRVYLDNWETKTLFAEADTTWNSTIQHRNHEAIEKLASLVDHTASLLKDALDEIDSLKKQIDQK